jgi:hypothetical protein
MKEIVELYKSKYKFDKFYTLISLKIFNNKILGNCYLSETKNIDDVFFKYHTKSNDVRIDLPIWFGDPTQYKLKIMVLGREPRDSHSKYNVDINLDNNYVFGSPFGIEFWTEKNKYYRSFKNIINNKEILTYFTDVVKKYEVKKSKLESDLIAKANFWKNAENNLENLELLKKEISIIDPDILVGLGNDSFNFLQKTFGEKYRVVKIVHPNARQDKLSGKNAWDIALEELDKIIIEFSLD